MHEAGQAPPYHARRHAVEKMWLGRGQAVECSDIPHVSIFFIEMLFFARSS
ncbi:MAG: hypothetical protein NTY92_00050 [Nitrosospira sp.]|nr:hypothetical protein [Nitrosospira sp.]